MTWRTTTYYVALFIIVLFIAIASVNIPRTQTVTTATTHVKLTLSRAVVWFPTACVTYDWQAESIATIYWRSNPTTGDNSAEYCNLMDETPPTLSIILTDGQQLELSRQPIILLRNTWTLTALALTLIVPVGLYLSTLSWSRALRVVEVTAIMAMITLLMLEGTFRLWVIIDGSQSEQLLYLGSADDFARNGAKYEPVPFINYTLAPDRDDVNAAGFRSPHITPDKPDGVYRIATLGGSTTVNEEVAWDEAWPAQLEAQLQARGANVDVLNAGASSYTTHNSLVNLAMRVLAYDPDLIIVYHAVNDARASMYIGPDCYHGDNLNIGLGYHVGWAFEPPQLSRSAFVRFANLQLGRMQNPLNEQYSNVRFTVDCKYQIQDTPNDPVYFERNLRSMIGIAQANDVDIMLSTWAYRYGNADTMPDTVDPLFVYADTLNDITRDVADETGVYFYDLDNELETNADYWQTDLIHQTASGTAAQARHYADYLMPLLP